MTLKETLRIVKEFGFTKQAVPTEASGTERLFHYFHYKIGDVQFMLSNDDEENGEWYGTIFNHQVKFYTMDSFVSVLLAVKQGQWSQ
jgi:hypothetical protein